MSTALRKVKRVRGQFLAAHGRAPTSTELAEAADVTPAKLQMLLSSERGTISLEAHRRSSDDRSWHELIPDQNQQPEQQIDALHRRQAVSDIVHSLVPAESEVVRALYLEADGRRAKTRDVALRLGCSAAQVRNVEKRALKKLARKPHVRALFNDLDFER